MDLILFLVIGIFFMALSSFSLMPFLASGILPMAWLGFGFLRFSFKATEILISLLVLSIFLALFSGIGIVFILFVLGLPLIVPLFLFNVFTKISGFWKIFFGGIIYLILLFGGLKLFSLGSFFNFPVTLLVFFIFCLFDFGISKILRRP